MTSQISRKNIVICILVAVILMSFFFTRQALAQEIDWNAIAQEQKFSNNDTNCSSAFWAIKNIVTCGILVPVSWFFGLLVSFTAFLLTWSLEINAGLADTSLVRGGFEITLAVANMGFVFAIIVIALATIIDYQTYGLKKNLWKLVAAALLVNFSLVICSVVISFFDQFAYFFARQMGAQNAIGYSGVSDQLVNSFGLHSLMRPSGVMAFLPSLIFMVIFLYLIAFTLSAIALSLIIRYIYLAILMILMPFAWLAWIVPGYQKHWTSWWENFMKWTMGPAIILTFLYIAITIATAAGTGVGGQPSQIETWTNRSTPGAGEVLKQIGSEITAHIIRMVIAMALVWGALIAANSLGARGAGMLVSGGKSASKSVQKRIARYRTRAKTYALRSQTGRALTQRLQTVGQNRGIVGRALSLPVRMAGSALSGARQSGEALLHEAEGDYKKLPLVEQARQHGAADGLGKFVITHNIHQAMEAAHKKLRGAEAETNPEKRAEKMKEANKELTEAQQALNLLPTRTRQDLEQYEHGEETRKRLEKNAREAMQALARAQETGDKTAIKLATNTYHMQQGLLNEARSRTRFGRMFVLYGEHEKKHKDKLDEVRKHLDDIAKEEKDKHGGGHGEATAETHPSTGGESHGETHEGGGDHGAETHH